jgi:hypothetical protein
MASDKATCVMAAENCCSTAKEFITKIRSRLSRQKQRDGSSLAASIGAPKQILRSRCNLSTNQKFHELWFIRFVFGSAYDERRLNSTCITYIIEPLIEQLFGYKIGFDSSLQRLQTYKYQPAK